ncbi:MAG: hypothetical protein Q8L06_01610 [Pseudohongiella sp.]|nr:hypothetical protein [Pseudohongiella sp.]
MKLPLPKQDLLLLRPTLIIFLVVLSLGFVAYQAATYYQQSSASALRSAQASYQQVSSSIEQIEQEESTVVRYIDRYQQMVARGVIGDGNRLQLIEQLSSLRQRSRLYPINIQIRESNEVAVSYPPEDPLPGDPVFVRAAPVSLAMALLHEGDLLQVLDALLVFPGLLQPKRCLIKPFSSASASFNSVTENLEASCEILWYNLALVPPVLEEY